MSTESPRKDRVESIFLEARELREAEHHDFLSKACRGEPEIRAAVESLLRADNQADSLLDRTVDLLGNPARNLGECEGMVIGPYKLLQRIGEGGFGVVYMAEQTIPVRRKVALKLIKPGMDSKEVVARFEAERQALAMMDHPSISKVLQAGTTESGRPYFAMELVKGVPITQYCDNNTLRPKQRLELFSQVCLAVQHAHQKGIIHRDIKPSNVMVTLRDGKPVPKVIDFGVAKALSQNLTDKTLFTQYGQAVGTPQYMSPEQAEMSGMDVDTRSDIYSLGILLFELLTGETPLDAHTLRSVGYDAMRKMICDSDPVKPSVRLRTLDNETASSVASLRSTAPRPLSKMLSGDLDWIVMKCLEKDRDRRYESANGLANDIIHYVLDEPVEAGPPTFTYQLSKLYRRNRAAVTSLASFAVLLIVGMTLVSFAWANAVANAEVAARAATRAKTTLEVIQSLFAKASPDPIKGTEVKVSDFLKSFTSDLDSVKLEDPRVEVEIRLTLASALARFSMSQEEQQQYEIAERIARETYPPRTEELARFLLKRSESLEYLDATGRLNEALGYLDDKPHTKTLDVEIRTQLGNKLRWDKPQQAKQQWIRACELTRQMSKSELASLRTNPFRPLAMYYHDFGQGAKGKHAAAEAIEFAKKAGKPREHVESILVMRHFVNNGARNKYLQQARDVARRAADGTAMVRVLQASCTDLRDGEFPHSNLGPEAKRLKDELVSDWKHLYGNHPPLGEILGLSMLLGNAEDIVELENLSMTLSPSERRVVAFRAAQWLRRGGMFRLAKDRNDRGPQDYVWVHGHKGRCYSAARDFRQAIPHMEKAIAMCSPEELTTPYWLRCELAFFIEASGEPEKAKVIFKELASDLSGMTYFFSPLRLICIAKSDQWDNTDPETIRSLEAEARENLAKDEKRGLAFMLSAAALGLLEEHRGNRDKQMEYFVIANRCRPGTFEQINGEWISEIVVKSLTEAGQTERLEKLLRDDVRHRDTLLLKIHPERAFTRIRLAKLLIQEGEKLDEAKTLLAEAASVYEYQGDWIPAEEHETLKSLQQKVVRSLGNQQ